MRFYVNLNKVFCGKSMKSDLKLWWRFDSLKILVFYFNKELKIDGRVDNGILCYKRKRI